MKVLKFGDDEAADFAHALDKLTRGLALHAAEAAIVYEVQTRLGGTPPEQFLPLLPGFPAARNS
jgi:hypothetical protein